MSDLDERMRRLFGASAPDAGCDGGMEVFDLYVELEVAGQDPAARYPGVANHLAACPDCREDHDALVALARTADPLAGA
jgi:hypothetical protein